MQYYLAVEMIVYQEVVNQILFVSIPIVRFRFKVDCSYNYLLISNKFVFNG